MLEDTEYLRVITPDICGTARSKILTKVEMEEFQHDGCIICLGILALCSDGTVSLRQLKDDSCGNDGVLKADWSTLYESKTASRSGAKYKDVIASVYDRVTGEPNLTDPRQVALRVLQQLDSFGLEALSTFEIEFRLLKPDGTPAWDFAEYSSPWVLSSIEPFITDLERSCVSAGIKVQVIHSEYGAGQIEVTIKPEKGILPADQGFLFKLIAKEVAMRHNFVASFVTKPLFDDTGSGWHLNLSVWTRDGSSNIFHSDGRQPSPMGRHFLGGMVHHAAALCALTSPTVNCYRRLHQPWAPDLCDVDVDNRKTSFRLQADKKSISRVENRLPSSACNPYLALACTVAAGIDGIRRGLEPDEALQKKKLPHTLAEALEALRNDAEMKELLGEEIVLWYDVMKTDVDVAKLGDIDVSKDNPEELTREWQMYQRL